MAKSTKSNLRKVIDWILLMVAVILMSYVAFKAYNIHKDNLLDKSVLDRVIGTISYEDFKKTKIELPRDAFVLVSYTKSSENRKMEKNLKEIILKNNLQDNFYYLDITDLTLENDYIGILNDKLKLSNNSKITNVPAIIYYKDEQNIKTINSDKDSMLDLNEFKKLLVEEKIIEG